MSFYESSVVFFVVKSPYSETHYNKAFMCNDTVSKGNHPKRNYMKKLLSTKKKYFLGGREKFLEIF